MLRVMKIEKEISKLKTNNNENKFYYGLTKTSFNETYGKRKSSFKNSFRFPDICKLCLTENTSSYKLLRITGYPITNSSLSINVGSVGQITNIVDENVWKFSVFLKTLKTRIWKT